MIQLTEKLSCVKETHQWVLYEEYESKDKDGKVIKSQRERYCSNFNSLIQLALDIHIGTAESLEELKEKRDEFKKIVENL